MGRVTRYMARIAHPGWQAYLKRRVDAALDAGADGIFYDNNFNEALPETYQAIYQHAARRKPDVLLMGNFHSNSYVLNRLTNAISTEDGREPGVYGGTVVNNIGLYRLLEGVSAGWMPVSVEHGRRERGDRFTNPLSAARHQLSIAEAAASGAAFQVFVEGAFADGLYRRRAATMEIWRAIGSYNRFVAANEALYAEARVEAPTAVVVDDSGESVAALNALAARSVQFEVLYEHDLKPGALSGYDTALVLARHLRPRAQAEIERFAGAGGKLGEAEARVKLDAPAGVLMTVTRAGGRRLVHLLNYTGAAVSGVKVTAPGSCGAVTLRSPDGASSFRAMAGAEACALEVARLGTYSVLVLEARTATRPGPGRNRP
jgi:hypothetical protein